VSLLDINEEIGNNAISQLKDKYKVFDRVVYIKCDVTNKNEFEGKLSLFIYA